MYDPLRQQQQEIIAAARVWETQAGQRRTDAAVGNLLRAVAQFPPQREPTAYERQVIEAARELAEALADA